MYCLNDHSILFYSFIIISRPASSSFTFFRDVFTSTFSSSSVLCVSCLSKAVFRKIYLVCFWILCLIYSMLSWSGCHSWCFYRSNINVNERSSLPDVFCKKRVRRNFAKLTRKYRHFVNQHPTSRTSHISNIPHPEHPTSRTSHISNIPHLQHLTSRTSHIRNIPHL